MVLACFLKIFFHASGMFIEKFISSKEWNKVALELKKKRKKRMLQTKEEGKKCKTRNNLFTSLEWFWPNHLGLLGACQCGWNSKSPNSVRQNLNLTKKNS